MTEGSAARVDAAAEALYAMLPAYVRSMDAASGLGLRALVAVLARGSAEIDAEIDRLLDAQFVETAPAESLPDFAALLGAEPLRPLPEGSAQTMRAYLANTIRYRRGKGTARVLEGLATDVGGFAATVVEYYQRIARLQHLIDPRPERPGTARLTPGETAAVAGTALDRLPRLVEVRSAARGGKHHPANVGVHLVRTVVPFFAGPAGESGIPPRALDGVPVAQPWRSGATVLPGYFQLAAQAGRPLRLFNPDRRDEADGDRAAPAALPDRLRRLPLHQETEELRAAAAEGRSPRLADQPWFDALGQPFAVFARRTGAADFFRVPPAELRICRLDDFPVPFGERPAAALTHVWGYDPAANPPRRSATVAIGCGFDPATGRMIFPEPPAGAGEIEEVRVAHGPGIGFAIGAGAQDRAARDIPFDVSDAGEERPFVCVVDGTVAGPSGSATGSALVVPTLKDAIDAWHAAAGDPAPPTAGVIVLVRCDRYAAPTLNLKVPTGGALTVVAGQWVPPASGPGDPVVPGRRGFIERVARRFTIDARVRVEQLAMAGRPAPGTLLLDGVELTRGINLGPAAVSELRLRHVTLRRPGDAALTTTDPPFELTVRAERSILGRLAPADGPQTAGSRLALRDCIVAADEAAGEAIAAPQFDADLANVTVFGDVAVREIDATNAVVTGALKVARTQTGCLRYSYVAPGPALPRRFRCQPELALAAAREAKGAPLSDDERTMTSAAVRPRFLDSALDEPTAAMLHPRCSDAIRRGGQGDTEMGAFALAATALREGNLAGFFADYLPFPMTAGLTDDSRSAAVAARRIAP